MSAHAGGPPSGGGSTMPQIAGVDSSMNSEINMTPMIDVMLVLLIIFMVITPAMAGYAWTAPKAVMSAPEKDDRVTLGIDNKGQYHIGDNAAVVAPGDLAEALRAEYASRPNDHVLYLKSDNAVQYGVVLTAIDAARIAGVRRIGAITEAPAGAPTTTEAR